MKLNIAVLAGDGIGPEISVQGVAVTKAVCQKFGHEVTFHDALVGAAAIDAVGDPFPEATYEICRAADAVLFSSVGDPKYDNNPAATVRPEQGLLAMRKKLGLFANIRPVETFDCLIHKSPLKDELVRGADFICIRELTGGIYFGERGRGGSGPSWRRFLHGGGKRRYLPRRSGQHPVPGGKRGLARGTKRRERFPGDGRIFFF